MAAPLPILELTRGEIVEAVHRGSIAVVASDGSLLRSYGDPQAVAFLRSSAKPFQALPFVEQGGVEHFHYTQSELALACASHESSQMHLDAVQTMQNKIGIEENRLQCGPHLPGDPRKLKEVIQKNTPLTANFNNCSGKHTTMLAYAKMLGLSLDDYLDFNHPIQLEIRKTLAEMCRMTEAKIQIGVDGCSAPNFALPLFNAALGMARLCDPRDLPSARAEACKKITNAMTAHPEMVGNFGEFDCELMKTCEGKIVTKRGAEGYQIIGVMSGRIHERGVGIAFKVEDGDKNSLDDNLGSHSRVRPPVTLEILRQLGALNESQLNSLAGFGPEKVLKNYAGLVTGIMRPAFKL